MDLYAHNKADLYRDVMTVLSQSTDDHLFIFDIERDEIRFFSAIDETYPIYKTADGIVTRSALFVAVHPADCKKLEENIERIMRGAQNLHNMDLRFIDKNQNVVWVSCRGTVIFNEDGAPSLMIGRISEEALAHLFNPLTGLWNKVKLREDLKPMLLQKQDQLLLLDIDGLAAINLQHGRKYGDMLIKQIARIIDEHPFVKCAYHVEHNNFMAIIEGDDKDHVRAVYDYMQEEMAEICTMTASSVPIDPALFKDVSHLLDSINLTLKTAKQAQTGQVEFFSLEDIRQNIRARTIYEALYQSIQNDFEGFEVFYQPQMRSGIYQIRAVEALLRYRLPGGERVFPDEFIPILEQTRLIEAVGLWVLEKALLQCKAWRKYIPDLGVSVNFSIIQFEDIFLGEKIMLLLQKTEMPGEALTVEITESIELQESKNFEKLSKLLRAKGVSFAIDDFGTGYSNLAYLKRLHADEIKIDRTFVTGIEKNAYNHKLVSNILEFAKTNDIRVCCEGIESTKELMILESMQPDFFQGYLFAKPHGAEQIEKYFIDDRAPEYAAYADFVKKLYRSKGRYGIVQLDPRDILREIDSGLWIVRRAIDGEYAELYADETMERMMAVEGKFTPQECYEHWFSRVKDEAKAQVRMDMQRMIEQGEIISFEFPWMHPTQGEITFCCVGKHTDNADGMIILKGSLRIDSK